MNKMDILHLFTSAPDIRTPRDDKPTLLLSWWCTCYAIAVIVIRFCGRYVRAEKIFLEDGIMCLAITPLLIRMAFIHVVLKNGTNNTVTKGLSELDIERRELGSQLVLAGRVFYAAYLWAIKLSTSFFLRSLTQSITTQTHRHLLRYLHIFLLLTFLATMIADLGACHPFSHYWQVIPDPGASCRTGAAHLYTTGILNIVTNLALVIFPIPLIIRSKIGKKQKSSILIRLSLPLLSVGLTLYAIPHISSRRYTQQTRSLLASLDILLSTFTSNAVVLFSLLADRGYKKSKYKYNPDDQPHLHHLNDPSNFMGGGGFGGDGKGRGREVWGSDEDLIYDDGKGAGIGLREWKGEDGLKRPGRVRVGGIRVNSTWEIRVDEL